VPFFLSFFKKGNFLYYLLLLNILALAAHSQWISECTLALLSINDASAPNV